MNFKEGKIAFPLDKEVQKQIDALAFIFYFLGWDYCCSTFIDEETITYGYIDDGWGHGTWAFALPLSFMERG